MELLPLLTALSLGFLHALEPDHMAAVTTFVSRRPRPLEALGFGVRWGLGHSAAILVVGSVLIALGIRFPESVVSGLEFGVGTMLLGLGVWLLWSVMHGEAHAIADPEHDHPHDHRGGSLWVGMAHGIAGTAPLVAVVTVTASSSPWAAGVYLLLFGVGTTAGMGLYAAVAGAVFHQAMHRVPALGGTLRTLTALGSAVLGVFWMVNAVA
jgi:ABC-type nickel/cobalt efflux system permease component RcnA